jgi:2-phosphoglycerate kinase
VRWRLHVEGECSHDRWSLTGIQSRMSNRVILIGGTSHTGKSSVARALADRMGWAARSTDSLARHPGRPWGSIPPQVILHYRNLPVEALICSVMAHYERLRPAIADIVEKAEGLVLEGSALLPHSIATLCAPAVILTASERVLEERIHGESGYAGAPADERFLIDKFVARACRFNEIVGRDAAASGVKMVAVDKMSPEEITETIAKRIL